MVRDLLNDEYLAVLSHELRTPLTSLTGFSELLAHRANALPPALVEEFGVRMWRASRWLSRMIGDLLDLSDIERGLLLVNVKPTDLEEAIRDVVDVDVADPRPIRRIGDRNVPSVLADGARLRQVLGNLLSNARKFSPPGSPVDIETYVEDERVFVSIRDHGRGISWDQIDQIFHPFVQLGPATTRETGGLGTGLFLAKELCERMGGVLRVASAPGEGSSFTVSLQPAAEAADRQPIDLKR
jgi:signal transduction histidine kinase